MNTDDQTIKAFIYYRKNYLFGIARPGALVLSESTVACYDNALQQVFFGPTGTVKAKEGFGVFRFLSMESK